MITVPYLMNLTQTRFCLLFPCLSISLFLFCLVMSINPAQAQQSARNRQTLEKEKKENLEKMKQLRTILKQTSSLKRGWFRAVKNN